MPGRMTTREWEQEMAMLRAAGLEFDGHDDCLPLTTADLAARKEAIEEASQRRKGVAKIRCD